jgi:hypothetical protein
MKINFRKITSAIASTAILGSTVALAAAANYPAPFVQNGVADVAIVYGNSLDLVAVTDISTSLSSALSAGGSAGAAGTDAYALFTSSTPIQLNNSLSSVRSSVTDSNLPTVLQDTDFSGNVDAETSFQIVLGTNPRVLYSKAPTTSDDPNVGLSIGTTAATYMYNATVTFDESVNFTHEDSEGESISLFGQDFTVSSATDNTKLVLFKSAETIYLSVGSASSVPSQTVEIDGATYTIELVAASDTSATIKVINSAGQSDQKEINEAASKKILGVEVAVNTADESTATNVIQAEILVGADRLTLQDGDEVKLGTDNTPIDGTQVDFGYSTVTANITQVLNKITVQVFAEDGSHDFVKSGGEFVDPVFGSFRILFDGLAVDLDDEDKREEISISPSGTGMGSISFASWQGDTLENWDWFNNKTGGRTGSFLGDDNEYALNVRELGQINESAFAMVGNEDEGVLLELTDITNGSSGYSDDSITFRNVITGDAYGPNEPTSEGAGTINIEGNSYTYTYIDNRAGDGAAHVRLNYPDSGTAGQIVLYPTIETSKGANIAFYEPLTIDLGDVDGAGTDAAGFKLPDGDGYTDVTIVKDGFPSVWNFTFGSTTRNVNVSLAASSGLLTVGKLTYNVTNSGTTSGNNNTVLYLTESEGSGNILRPSIVLFEEQDEADVYNTVIVESSGAGVSDAGTSISEASFSWNSDADMSGTAYGATGVEMESTDDIFVKLDQYGTLVTTDQTDSDQYKMTISYPDEQAVAMIYVDSLAAGSGSGNLGNVRVMDDELASSGMSGKNLIVVGGSCVNTAASTLLGGAACGASWTAATSAGSGEWVIQSFANPWASSKIATLVAGWEQGDTANAATYLRTKNPDVSVGKKWTGTTSSVATSV